LRSGDGIYTYKDGSIFIGVFKDNEKDGIGRMSYFGRGDYHGINFQTVSLIHQVNSSMERDTVTGFSPIQIRISTPANGKMAKSMEAAPISLRKRVAI
jgi:hypothetical protein